jgi:peptidoglycan hydrolase-like protein with peptidoglycan-binding domain
MTKIGLSLFFLTVLLASLALPQSANSTTSRKTLPKKTTSSKKGKAAKKSAPVANRQMAPTPERYRDIQQSLVEKGYLKSEPNGVWDAQSTEALRQFQTDQKLTPTGKLSSATLIGLGLGPKTPASQPQPEQSINLPDVER